MHFGVHSNTIYKVRGRPDYLFFPSSALDAISVIQVHLITIIGPKVHSISIVGPKAH